MVEIILILGLLFIFGLTVLLHILATIDSPNIRNITDAEPNPELHPWFVFIEAILLLAVFYIAIVS